MGSRSRARVGSRARTFGRQLSYLVDKKVVRADDREAVKKLKAAMRRPRFTDALQEVLIESRKLVAELTPQEKVDRHVARLVKCAKEPPAREKRARFYKRAEARAAAKKKVK